MSNPPVTGRTRDLVILLDKLIYAIAKHWLLIANLTFIAYVGLPLLAPALMAHGQERWGRLIYTVYTPFCHQLPERSYFLYGPRFSYSLPELLALLGGNVPARFVGNPEIGYKVALCQRDVAMYAAAALAGMAFGLVRKGLRPLWGRSFVRWAILFALPLAVDGGGQLFGFWESTWITRTITGVIAGTGAVWLIYPHIEAGMQDVRRTAVQQLRLHDPEVVPTPCGGGNPTTQMPGDCAKADGG